MKKTISTISGLFMFLCSFEQENPNSLTLDLGNLDGTEKSPTVSPIIKKKLEVIYLASAFPNRTYIITINVMPKVLPPLSVGGAGASGSACTGLETDYNTVRQFATVEDPLKKEKELKQKLADLDKEKVKSGCADITLLNKIVTLQNNCKRSFSLAVPIEMEDGNDYLITITTGERSFAYKFEGKDRGKWLTSYGFLFSSKGVEPSRYYVDQIGTDSFRIKKRTTSNVLDLRFAPTVFFSWFPNANLAKTWNHSLSLGLGFNFESPVVSIGYNAMFNQNIGFSTGIVFYEQEKLNTKYRNDQIVKENLSDSQLYEKSFFRPNLFLAINIRLGDNPFKSSGKEPAK
ncbi:MAG: hypothetical protein V4722_09260 [Bacteroidota bacterium]